MREILFRAKRLDNGEWVEGAFCPKNSKGDIPCIVVYNGTFAGWWFEVDPDTVGQFTGLYANGKRIFEGDIIVVGNHDEYPLYIQLVEYAWVALSKEHEYYRHRLEAGMPYEVIGNIHDNPDLVKENEV